MQKETVNESYMPVNYQPYILRFVIFYKFATDFLEI